MLIDAFLPLHQTIQAATEGEYRFVAKWGPPDLTRDGNVKKPTGIAVDTAGLVYVADRGNNRVQKFTSAGNLISKWGSQGSGNGQFSAPSEIAVDTARNVYVFDSGNHRIQKFSSSGEFILAWGSKGSGDGQQLAAYAGGSGYGAYTGIFPKIEKNGWTGIAFVNTEGGDASVMLTAYNDNGAVVATWALALGGYAKVVNFAEKIFPLNIGSATYIVYTSDRNVVGFQLNGSADGTMLDGLPALYRSLKEQLGSTQKYFYR